MTTSFTSIRGLRTVVIVAMILIEFGSLKMHWGDVVDLKPDFAALYGTAEIMRAGKRPHYNPSTIQGIDVGYDSTSAKPAQPPQAKTDSLHPPFESLLFLPLTFFSYKVAYLTWYCLSLLLLWCTPLVLWLYLPHLHRDFHFIAILLGSMLPVLACLITGQDSILLLFLVSCSYVSLQGRRDVTGGFLLGLGMFKFQLILPIVAVLLLARAWRVVAGFGIALFALILGSFALVGVRTTIAYVPFVLAFSKHISENLSPRTVLMPNLRGMVSLIFGGTLSPSAQTILILLISGVLFGVVASWYLRNPSLPTSLKFSALVMMSCLVSYHFYVHNAVLLVLPLFLLANYFAGAQENRAVTLAFATIAILMYIVPVLAPLNIGVQVLGIGSLCLLVLLIAYPGFARLSKPALSSHTHRTA